MQIHLDKYRKLMVLNTSKYPLKHQKERFKMKKLSVF